MSHSRLYQIWADMKNRCLNENCKSYKEYGGRGITICGEWRIGFETFRDWAYANGYSDELTIDRIDVNGDYCPENCRWATAAEQMNNLRKNVHYEVDGVRLTNAEWARIIGVTPQVMAKEYKRHGDKYIRDKIAASESVKANFAARKNLLGL